MAEAETYAESLISENDLSVGHCMMDAKRNLKYRIPPGPKGLPAVGSLLEFRRDPLRFLTRLAADYGDIASFRLGRQLAVQLNHPDLIRDVLVTNSHNFTKTRGLDRAKTVIGNGLLNSEGDFHRSQRRLAQPLFNRDRISSYGAIITGCAVELDKRWSDGIEVDMSAEMLRLTLSIVGHTLFGIDIAGEADEIGQAMTVVFQHFNRLMMPFSGFIERLGLPSHRRFIKAKALLDQTVYSMIEQRRKNAGEERDDLLSKLLRARDEDGNQMTDQQVRDEAMTIFLAGHETTATWLTWTWYLLATNPAVREKLQSELDVVLSDRPPSADDLSKLIYTRMVLAESLRLYPPVWTLTRRAREDYVVGDFVLPAGTIVGMSQYVMHRDSRYYPEPDMFEPLRWTEAEISNRPKYAFFPFGGGPRLCIGEAFAWMEATLILSTLAQMWHPQTLSKNPPAFQPLITLRPKAAMNIRLEVRSKQTQPLDCFGMSK